MMRPCQRVQPGCRTGLLQCRGATRVSFTRRSVGFPTWEETHNCALPNQGYSVRATKKSLNGTLKTQIIMIILLLFLQNVLHLLKCSDNNNNLQIAMITKQILTIDEKYVTVWKCTWWSGQKMLNVWSWMCGTFPWGKDLLVIFETFSRVSIWPELLEARIVQWVPSFKCIMPRQQFILVFCSILNKENRRSLSKIYNLNILHHFGTLAHLLEGIAQACREWTKWPF